jgi:hypothetical protein
MTGPILTGGTGRAGGVTLGMARTHGGTVARILETNAPVTRASVTHVSARHALVVTRASAATHARRAGPARALAGTRC